jgi:hypothetical protein
LRDHIGPLPYLVLYGNFKFLVTADSVALMMSSKASSHDGNKLLDHLAVIFRDTCRNTIYMTIYNLAFTVFNFDSSLDMNISNIVQFYLLGYNIVLYGSAMIPFDFKVKVTVTEIRSVDDIMEHGVCI